MCHLCPSACWHVTGSHLPSQLERMAAAGDPALARETFMDKVLEPFTRDAKDEGAARAYASSYYSYVAEREAEGRPYDPVGKMTASAEFDTSKLPGSTDEAEISKVGWAAWMEWV
jgi:hypothetical protein